MHWRRAWPRTSSESGTRRRFAAWRAEQGDGAAHWSADFWVHDANAAVEKAAELGGRTVAPPSDSPGFRSAVLADPSGVTFSINQLTR